MSKSPEIAQQIKNVTSVFRALITSRKQPCPLREIIREYPEVESKPLNPNKLGFKSIEDLLRESGEFVLTKLGGETCIAAKYNKNSSHIALMVRGQKSSGSKSNKTIKRAQIRQPMRPSDQSWNKSSYSSNVYQKLPQTTNKFILSQNRMNSDSNNNNSNQVNNKNAHSQKQTAVPQQKNQRDLREVLNTKKNNTQKDNKMMPNGKQQQQQQQIQPPVQDLRDRLNAKQAQQQQQQNQKQYQQDTTTPRAILGQNNNANSSSQRAQNQQAAAAKLQNSHAISVASSMILAQRQQMAVIQQQIQHSIIQQTRQAYKIPQKPMQHYQQPEQRQQQQEASYKPEQKPQQKLQQQQSSTNQSFPRASNKTNKQQHREVVATGEPGRNSVQDRLKIKITNDNKGTTPHFSQAISPDCSSQSSKSMFADCIKNPTQDTQIIPPKIFQFNPKLDPVTSLSQYCVVRRCAQPEYTFFRSKFTKHYQCRVLINGSIFSTYPNEYSNEQTAKYSCASMAIEEIKIQESRQHLPLCTDSDQDLKTKIYQELKSHPHGIFAKNLPEWFESTFQQLLPDHWWSLIEESDQFSTETSSSDSLIIFANNNFENSENQESDQENFSMQNITLPWADKYWNLYVTHCVSTVEIWARLFGNKYSDKLDNLMNDIEMHMLTEKTRPVSVACNQIYLVCISECWHRVRLVEVDKLNAIGLCFFIDFGDEDWVPVSQLYFCEKKFLELPPQAVLFSLFGLEDFAGNPNAKKHLDAMLASKSVVGEILTKKEAYQADEEENRTHSIQIVLYDTSSQEDVNLNPLILHRICDDTPPPEIKRTGLTNVLISHITDAGDVFLQVRNSELQYVQKLIYQLIESKFKKEQHKVTRADIQNSSLFLICDKTNNEWYRGTLANNQVQPDDEEFEIFYIDHGIQRRTHISNMFLLESLSTALTKFPWQGIKAKLDKIPEISPGIVARMRGLLPAGSRALVKIGTPSAAAVLIIVYKRFEGSEALCNVNEVIRIEHELECSSNDLLDETVTSDAKVSGSAKSGSLPTTGTSLRNSSSSDLQQTLRNLTFKNVSQQKSDNMVKLKNYEDVPNLEEFFDVRVSMAANPYNFMIQSYKDYPKLRVLMKDLQDYCEVNDEFIPADMVEIGQAYAAKNKDGFYHRVIVVNTYQDLIHVSFCDFGDVDILRSDQLKTLPAKFRTLPKQAIEAKLYGIIPRNVDWALEDCLRFRELTAGKKFVSVIKKITNIDNQGTLNLELDLIDVQTDEDIFIRDILIKEERATEMKSD